MVSSRQSKGGSARREPMRTGTSRAASPDATRRPVLPVPASTSVVGPVSVMIQVNRHSGLRAIIEARKLIIVRLRPRTTGIFHPPGVHDLSADVLQARRNGIDQLDPSASVARFIIFFNESTLDDYPRFLSGVTRRNESVKFGPPM